MSRFVVHEIYGMSAEDRERFDLGKYADDGALLEDTITGETYMDGWEPEDATFMRDLGWVPALLNELAEETGAARTEIDRLTAERTALLAPVEGVDVEEVLRLADAPARTLTAAEDRDSALAYAALVLAREVARLRSRLAAMERERDEMAAAGRAVVEATDEMRAKWAEIEERLQTRLDVMETERNEARDRLADARADHLDAVDDAKQAKAEHTAEARRHECAVTRLSAVRAALLDETGSAPSITDPPDIWSRETRAALAGAKCLAEEMAALEAERNAAVLRAENAYAEGRADGQAEAEAAADAKP